METPDQVEALRQVHDICDDIAGKVFEHQQVWYREYMGYRIPEGQLDKQEILGYIKGRIQDAEAIIADTDWDDSYQPPLAATVVASILNALDKRTHRLVNLKTDFGPAIYRAILDEEPPRFGIEIPDSNLRAVISDNLNKARGAPITRADMATLTRIGAGGKNINDLTGLEYATNLTRLNLDINQISDIAALSTLTKLTRLDLSFNGISDIAALSGLTNLTSLYLYDNQISDLAPLSRLTNLTMLSLEENQISDLAALSGLTNLEVLWLDDNPLSATSINTHIPALEARRGVSVIF